MRAPLVLSFLAAAFFHAALLFGFQFGTLARPLPMGDGSPSLEVGLAGAPGDSSEPAAEPSQEPAESPAEPAATPEPQPTPQATPVPEAAPTPVPTPEPIAVPTPEPIPSVPSEAAATPPPQSSPTPPAPQPKAVAKPKPQTESRGTHRPGTQDGKPHNGGNNGSGSGAGTGGGGGGTGALPRYRNNPKPVYPPEARRDRQEGVVLLSVEIGADGEPKSVTLKRTSGFPLLDEAALRAVRRWSFIPATMAGLPVASHADIPIRFNLAQ